MEENVKNTLCYFDGNFLKRHLKRNGGSSCLLGRPWIHEAGAVMSTLHQKLKFVSHGKLVTVSGESALLVSHLSAFSYISRNDVDETSVQGFAAKGSARKGKTCIASLKDAQKLVQEGKAEG